jgi:hypothetical protein
LFDNRRDVSLVLGMHRSGTSAIAGTLVKMGAAAPEGLMPPHVTNPRGFWESWRMMRLNDELLASAGSRWDDWRKLDAAWYATPQAAAYMSRARDLIAAEFGDAPWIMVKDPRICRLMPFWGKLFADDSRAVHLVLPVRSPLEVARSLQTRDGFPATLAFLLWLRHTLDAELASRETRHAIIDWAAFCRDWRRAIAQAAEQIGAGWPAPSEAAAADIDEYLTPELRHHRSDTAELAADREVNDWVMNSYDAMLRLAEDPSDGAARQTLDQVRAEFDKASLMFGRHIEDYDARIASALAERDQLQSQLADQRGRAEAAAAAREEGAAALAQMADRAEAAAAAREQSAAALVHMTARAEAAEAERDRNAAAMAHVAARAEAAEETQRALTLRLQAEAVEKDALRDRLQAERDGFAAAKEALSAEAARSQDEILRLHRALVPRRPPRAAAALLARLARRPRDYALVKSSGLFDAEWYLERYRDVAELGADPIAHYLRHGAWEGRDPSPHFRTAEYLAAHPDVEANGINPLVHYIRYGIGEGRRPRRPTGN